MTIHTLHEFETTNIFFQIIKVQQKINNQKCFVLQYFPGQRVKEPSVFTRRIAKYHISAARHSEQCLVNNQGHSTTGVWSMELPLHRGYRSKAAKVVIWLGDSLKVCGGCPVAYSRCKCEGCVPDPGGNWKPVDLTSVWCFDQGCYSQ